MPPDEPQDSPELLALKRRARQMESAFQGLVAELNRSQGQAKEVQQQLSELKGVQYSVEDLKTSRISRVSGSGRPRLFRGSAQTVPHAPIRGIMFSFRLLDIYLLLLKLMISSS